MNLLGWTFSAQREEKQQQFESVLQRIIAAQAGEGIAVSPENCMQSPTVHAVVTAVSRRLAVSPIHVYQRGETDGKETKTLLRDHPLSALLDAPNEQQTRTTYWLDAVSCLIRYGNFYAYKGRGVTGPIRFLAPLHPTAVEVKQDGGNFRVTYVVTSDGVRQEFPARKIHHVRGAARNFLTGDSPIEDIKRSIALEIAAEEFGSTFFENGALPLIIFKYAQTSKGMKSAEDEKRFVDQFQAAFGGKKRHRALLLPLGVEASDPIRIENDKSQMLETRKHQRTVIAGALGVPPHLVGDLERATFNNVEQQDSDFTLNVVLPVAQQFESAMEADLLAAEEKAAGIIIRFNLDAILRADFKSRQEGLQIQKRNNVISANEWREIEGKNPISEDDGGDDYLHEANLIEPGAAPPATTPPGATQTAPPAKGDTTVIANFTIEQGDTTIHAKHQHEAQDVTVKVTTPDVVVNQGDFMIHPQTIDLKMPNVHVYPAEMTIHPSQITITHTVEPTEVTVHSPKTTVFNEMPEIKFPAPVVNIAPPAITVEAPTINVAAPDVKVEQADVHVHNEVPVPAVTIAAPNVTVTAPDVFVEGAKVDVHNEIPAPIVNVDAPVVNVSAPDVFVEATKVEVTNEIEAPIVNVMAPDVKIEPAQVTVVTPAVTVNNEVTSPDVIVEAPNVTVEAPAVKLIDSTPDFDVVETETIRDKKTGDVIKTIARRKRKK